MSIQAAFNRLIGVAGGTVGTLHSQSVAQQKALEREAKEAAKASQPKPPTRKQLLSSLEALQKETETQRDIAEQMKHRIDYLSRPRGAAEVIAQSGILSGRKAKELLHRAEKEGSRDGKPDNQE